MSKGNLFDVDSETNLWSPRSSDEPAQLTVDTLRRGMEALMSRDEREQIEFHSPKCTLFSGDMWCSCGARPLDRFLKAEMERKP